MRPYNVCLSYCPSRIDITPRRVQERKKKSTAVHSTTTWKIKKLVSFKSFRLLTDGPAAHLAQIRVLQSSCLNSCKEPPLPALVLVQSPSSHLLETLLVWWRRAAPACSTGGRQRRMHRQGRTAAV
jgi:hypothetical protein